MAARRGGKAEPAAAPAPPPLDPEALAEQRALVEQCKAMKAQKYAEEAQLAQFHEEKERLNQLWIIAKRDLEEAKAKLRGRAREREDVSESHAVEIKVYKQRIKHLLFEHQAEATDSRTEGQVALKLAQESHRGSEGELKGDRRDLKAVLREMETAHEDYLKALKLEHDRAITELRLEFERETREMASIYEDRMVKTRDELNRGREEDIRGIERRKSRHIAALVAAHEKAFADIKMYYNEITHSNLDLIKTLKEEVEEMKRKEALDEKTMYSIAQENKKMSEPMQKALAEVERLAKEREAYRLDLQALHEGKAAILVVEDRLENLRWEAEILEQRYGGLTRERDALYDKFQQALHGVKQTSGFKSLLLERRLAAAAEEVERQTLTLTEVLAAARLEPAVLGKLEKKLTDVMAAKEGAIRELEAELSRVAAAHDRLIDSYARKTSEYGIPMEELGFKPLRAAEILAGVAATAPTARLTATALASATAAAPPVMDAGSSSSSAAAAGAAARARAAVAAGRPAR